MAPSEVQGSLGLRIVLFENMAQGKLVRRAAQKLERTACNWIRFASIPRPIKGVALRFLISRDHINLRRVSCVCATLEASDCKMVIGVGIKNTQLGRVIHQMAELCEMKYHDEVCAVEDNALAPEGAGGRSPSWRKNCEVDGSQGAVVFVAVGIETEGFEIRENLAWLLNLPCGSVVVFLNSGNSSAQRKLLSGLLAAGYWSVREAAPGFVVVVRHSSVYIEEDGDPLAAIRIAPDCSPPSQDIGCYATLSDLTRPILTSYFTSCPDPQGKAVIRPDDFEMMRPWAESIRRNRLTGVVFHDELSEDFVDRHQSEWLRFVRVPPSKSLSLNDYRFLVWRDWLCVNRIDAVFFSDLFDVVVNRDPFSIFESLGRPLMLSHQGSRIGETGYFVKNFTRVYGDGIGELMGLLELNAGVWGGAYGDVMRFLVLMATEFEKPSCPFNANMPVFNWVAYRRIGLENFWSRGEPFHSEFQKFNYEADVAFVHK